MFNAFEAFFFDSFMNIFMGTEKMMVKEAKKTQPLFQALPVQPDDN